MIYLYMYTCVMHIYEHMYIYVHSSKHPGIPLSVYPTRIITFYGCSLPIFTVVKGRPGPTKTSLHMGFGDKNWEKLEALQFRSRLDGDCIAFDKGCCLSYPARNHRLLYEFFQDTPWMEMMDISNWSNYSDITHPGPPKR